MAEVDADGLEQDRGTKAPALLGETALLQEQDESYTLVQRSYRCAPSARLLAARAGVRVVPAEASCLLYVLFRVMTGAVCDLSERIYSQPSLFLAI